MTGRISRTCRTLPWTAASTVSSRRCKASAERITAVACSRSSWSRPSRNTRTTWCRHISPAGGHREQKERAAADRHRRCGRGRNECGLVPEAERLPARAGLREVRSCRWQVPDVRLRGTAIRHGRARDAGRLRRCDGHRQGARRADDGLSERARVRPRQPALHEHAGGDAVGRVRPTAGRLGVAALPVAAAHALPRIRPARLRFCRMHRASSCSRWRVG